MPSRTDEMISKGMAKMKAAQAVVRGLVGVFRTLMEQHGEVTALLRRVRSDRDKRAELWPTIREELLSHERAEIRVLYPALRAVPATVELAERHDREASQLEMTIERLQQTPIESDDWGKLFEELVKLVEHHVADEEGDIFPTAQDALGEPRARELDAEYLSAKKAAMAQA